MEMREELIEWGPKKKRIHINARDQRTGIGMGWDYQGNWKGQERFSTPPACCHPQAISMTWASSIGM